MKNTHIIIIATMVLAGALSCKKMDSISHNPYTIYPEEATSEQFVQPILFNTEYSWASIFRSLTGPLMQMSIYSNTEVSSRVVANYNIPESVDDDLWISSYAQLGNTNYMLSKAVNEENPAMEGVGLILKVLLASHITDAYGNVPYFEAGQLYLQEDDAINLSPKYDEQKAIYADMLYLLEKANRKFNDAKTKQSDGVLSKINFAEPCDYTYKGDIDKWQRFGNALYLRLLMRVSLKVEEETGGVFSLSDGSSLDIKSKIAELYDCYVNDNGSYPMMRGPLYSARVPFSENDAYTQTPFYKTTNGIWNMGGRSCETLVRYMLPTKVNQKNITNSEGMPKTITYYSGILDGSQPYDPRYDCFYHKTVGIPTQLLNQDQTEFIDNVISSADNSLVGSMPSGGTASAYSKKVFNIKNADFYSLLNYSEQMFLFAEAAQRGFVNASFPTVRELYIQAIAASINEWRPEIPESDENLQAFLADRYSKIDADNALQSIITEKWVSLFFVDTEAWNEYRRTGYPLLKTNGPAAENNNILPTRLRYPADDAYRNPAEYSAQINGWLGGNDNLTTDVWWADTAESRAIRKKGRL